MFVGTGCVWGSLFVEGGQTWLNWVLSRIRILWIGLSAVSSPAIADEMGGTRNEMCILKLNPVFHPLELLFIASAE